MPDAVEPTLPDDAIEAAARAMHEAQNPPVMITRESARIANARRPNEPERRIIRIALAAAYPVLRAHIETELREKIAGEVIEAWGDWIWPRKLNDADIAHIRDLITGRVARGEQP